MSVFLLHMASRVDEPGGAVEPVAAEESASQEAQEDDAWLGAFHAGERASLERCYREQFDTVDRAVGAIVSGAADRETLVHEVFFRLLNEERLRRQFRGGSLAAWLRVVARNQAIDYARRRRIEVRLAGDADPAVDPVGAHVLEHRIDVRLTLERFRDQMLPPKWRRVFDARFLQQQDQREAARALGMRRTTLAYQEYRIRQRLRRFMLRGESK